MYAVRRACAAGLAEGPEVQAALDRISADSLRGHLSFIASDALEGRNTPSRGLDLAAELSPPSSAAPGLKVPSTADTFRPPTFPVDAARDAVTLTLENHGKEASVNIAPSDLGVLRGNATLHLASAPPIYWPPESPYRMK